MFDGSVPALLYVEGMALCGTIPAFGYVDTVETGDRRAAENSDTSSFPPKFGLRFEPPSGVDFNT
jgi:hypothetical protein